MRTCHQEEQSLFTQTWVRSVSVPCSEVRERELCVLVYVIHLVMGCIQVNFHEIYQEVTHLNSQEKYSCEAAGIYRTWVTSGCKFASVKGVQAR